jgi:hypothetical protein
MLYFYCVVKKHKLTDPNMVCHSMDVSPGVVPNSPSHNGTDLPSSCHKDRNDLYVPGSCRAFNTSSTEAVNTPAQTMHVEPSGNMLLRRIIRYTKPMKATALKKALIMTTGIASLPRELWEGEDQSTLEFFA